MLACLSYLIMIIPDSNSLINPFWLVAGFLLVTFGELCLYPNGLSTTTKRSPAAFKGQIVSIGFSQNA
nr:hypothetical protein [Staphylococcus pseudintermedius]